MLLEDDPVLMSAQFQPRYGISRDSLTPGPLSDNLLVGLVQLLVEQYWTCTSAVEV